MAAFFEEVPLASEGANPTLLGNAAKDGMRHPREKVHRLHEVYYGGH